MQAGELFISHIQDGYTIRVTGRATFECAPVLRDLAKSVEHETFKQIYVDLQDCQWMDSTFMGVLAMLGLRSKKIAATMYICNASQQNTELLFGLGLKKLFTFIDKAGNADGNIWQAQTQAAPDTGARTVLDAHETLMSVDDENVKRFGQVVNLVRKDLDSKYNNNQGK